MHEFAAAGVRVYALSYDEPEALRDFRDAYDITYTLLADPESAVIRDFGILNTLIAEDDHPWFGIPFPGTYVADASGRVTHKFFENNLVLRAGPEQLLRAVAGEAAEASASRTADPARQQIQPEVFVDGEQLAVGVLRDLVVRFEVPRGRHLYATPAPSGMLAVDLLLDPHSKVVTRPLQRPASTTHTLAATAERFEVHSGTVELRLPITVNGALVSDEGIRETVLSGSVSWQVCDDEVCDVPQQQAFEITVPVAGAVLSELNGRPGDAEFRAMNALAHFRKMKDRRLEDG